MSNLLMNFARRRPLMATAGVVIAGALAFWWRSDLPFLWHERGIRVDALPYVDRVIEYPAVSGLALWVIA